MDELIAQTDCALDAASDDQNLEFQGLTPPFRRRATALRACVILAPIRGMKVIHL
jgi:hypothetical protein